jgi:hypothetical protein
MATGGVTLLAHLLTEKPKNLGTERTVMMRKSMPRSIHDLKTSATKMDILGISLTDFLNEALTDRSQDLIKNILFRPGVRMRVMFQHPKSIFLRQRSFEDGDPNVDDLLERQIVSIENCVRLYHKLEATYKNEQQRNPQFEPRGTLIVKLIEACPYISYERYDFNIYWGMYTSDSPGKDAPVFLTNVRDNEMYEKLKAHFLALLQNGYEELTLSKNNHSDNHNVLISVTHRGPWINKPLVSSLLGTKRAAELLKKNGRAAKK